MKYILEFLLYFWQMYAYTSSDCIKSDEECGDSIFEWKLGEPKYILRNNKTVKVSADEIFEEVVDKKRISARVFKPGYAVKSSVVYKPKDGRKAYLLEVAHSEHVNVFVDEEMNIMSVNVNEENIRTKSRVYIKAIRSKDISEYTVDGEPDSTYVGESEEDDFRPVVPKPLKKNDKSKDGKKKDEDKDEEDGEKDEDKDKEEGDGKESEEDEEKKKVYIALNSDIRGFPKNKILVCKTSDVEYHVHYKTVDGELSVDKDVLAELKEIIELDCELDVYHINKNTAIIKKLLVNNGIREELNMEYLIDELKDSESCKEGYRSFREKCRKDYIQICDNTLCIDGISRKSKDKCQEVSRFLVSGDCCQLLRMGIFVQMCAIAKSSGGFSCPYEELLFKSFSKRDMGISRFFLDTIICFGKHKGTYVSTLLEQWNSYITNHWYSYHLAREKYRNEKEVFAVLEHCCTISGDVMEGYDVPSNPTIDTEESEEEKRRKRNTKTQKKSSSGIWGKVGIAAVVITAGIIIGGFCWYIF